MRRLFVRNVGPIREASVDVAPWVIVVGGNASGKTVLSTVHYLTFFQSLLPRPWRINLNIREGLQEASVSVRDLLEENRELFRDLLIGEVRRLFGVEPHDLVSLGEDEGEVAVITDSLTLRVIIDRRSNTVDFNLSGDEKLSVVVEYKRSSLPACIAGVVVENNQYRVSVMGNDPNCALPTIGSYILSKVFGDPLTPAVFLSTERIATLTLYPSIMRLVLPPESATVNKPLLMDFLRWILPGEYREEISELTIMYQPPNAIMAKADKGSIPPSLISTGAYQAFAIEAVARNPMVRTMIIEEPEINLHADAEIKMAKYLANIKDKNMFITTHSEWIVMGIAHELLRQGRLRDLRVYEIRSGEVVEVPVKDNGEVGTLETVMPVKESYLREVIGEVLSHEQGGVG